MSFFLLTYARRNGDAPQLERLEDADEAMEKFVEAERLHRRRDDGLAVVLLIADGEETLRRTHSHYFMSAAELLDAVRTAH